MPVRLAMQYNLLKKPPRCYNKRGYQLSSLSSISYRSPICNAAVRCSLSSVRLVKVTHQTMPIYLRENFSTPLRTYLRYATLFWRWVTVIINTIALLAIGSRNGCNSNKRSAYSIWSTSIMVMRQRYVIGSNTSVSSVVIQNQQIGISPSIPHGHCANGAY